MMPKLKPPSQTDIPAIASLPSYTAATAAIREVDAAISAVTARRKLRMAATRRDPYEIARFDDELEALNARLREKNEALGEVVREESYQECLRHRDEHDRALLDAYTAIQDLQAATEALFALHGRLRAAGYQINTPALPSYLPQEVFPLALANSYPFTDFRKRLQEDGLL
jgi:hypothetical protein